MNFKKRMIGMATIMLLILVSGCTTPAVQTPDLAATIAVNVAVEQTLAALGTQTILTELAYQQMNPTETPTPQPTATSEFTATPDKVTLTLSKDTYCRNGVFAKSPFVALMTAGRTYDVLAVDPNNQAFYVVEPDHTFTYCWLWGEFATVSGDVASLPIYTPQPLPTPTKTATVGPDFSVSYIGQQVCGADYYLRFSIKNNGSKTWQALQINTTDNFNNAVTPYNNTVFVDYVGCTAGVSESDLAPGENSNVAVKISGDPTGHSMTATIILCQTDASGGCNPKTINFTP
ncbi:MAG: hypothetical protein CVU42_11010 [Chloroflexi bacterium HGW-Chloroflexi-4]|jgi:hypothetical protein|nr:MAG: hypothetical protein CVU42_11010 [Chloroflexi bacterium HGW-Chloroflexi-4]